MSLECPSMTPEEREFWRTTGNEIARMRRSHGKGMSYDKRRVVFSQKKLADALGLTRCSVANIEAGKHRISYYTFCKIQEILK